MNYLAHLYLSAQSDDTLTGALLGDFVKGDDHTRYNAAVAQAILLHRAVDTFTDAHPVHRRSKRRLNPRYRHGRGVVIDLFYDHFLARDWGQWAQPPLGKFCRRVYTALRGFDGPRPERLGQMLPYMIRDNWLASYWDLRNVGKALAGIERRLQGRLPLSQGLTDLEEHYSELEQDFQEFMPELRDYVAKTSGGRSDIWTETG